MMKKAIDLTGKTFDRLKVIKLSQKRSGGHLHWVCKCKCGNVVTVAGYNLRNGNTKSCGCLQKDLATQKHTKHGEAGTRLFNAWVHMKQRCYNPNDRAFKHYGYRGISVCDEWKDSFTNFRDWAIANGYDDNLTIDRIDVNGNYEPNNCRWITIQEQQRNKRDNVRIEHAGQVKTISEWAKEFNCFGSSVYREILKREGRLHSEGY